MLSRTCILFPVIVAPPRLSPPIASAVSTSAVRWFWSQWFRGWPPKDLEKTPSPSKSKIPVESEVRVKTSGESTVEVTPNSSNKSASDQPPSESANSSTVNVSLSNELAIGATGTLPDEFALSLSGCGFLGCYHFGVIIAFQKHGQSVLSKVTRIAGASAGSLVAALMILCPENLEMSLHKVYSMADEINSMMFGALTPGFRLNERLAEIARVYLPEDISLAQNKLFISLTRQRDHTNKLVSTFRDREHLMQCLLASCFIPVYSMGYGANPPEIDGEVYIDGGYTENCPVFKDMPTVTISPFSGSAKISPHDQNVFEWRMRLGNQHMKVNLSNIVRGAQALFPPSSRTLHAYYEMGYRDGMRFLLNHGYLNRQEGTEV